jgi:LysM repeat protein
MKRRFIAVCLVCIAAAVRAQDSASAALSSQEAEENYKSLRGKVQDMLEAQAADGRRIQGLEKEIADLRDQVGKPNTSYATQEELKRLAETVQEIDRKREADTKRILDEFAKLGKTLAATPPPPSHTTVREHVTSEHSTSDHAVSTPNPPERSDENGFTYQIKAGDNLSLIAQAYREQQGVKVTVKQILDANPGLNADKLVIGKKIFIPAPKTTASK